ncbi:MAG: hypothetical protein ACE5GO_07970 [Anaerolineales bacterium]
MSEIHFTITVDEHDTDDEFLDTLTRRLRDDLLDMGADAVRPSGGALPHGAKAIDIPTLNEIVVAVAPVGLTGLLDFLQKWKLRSKTRTLKIKTPGGFEIEFPTGKAYSEEEFLALIDKLRARE